MKNRTLTYLLALAAVIAFVPEASAQRMFPNSDPVSRALTADDSDVALLIKYVGSSPFSSVEVSSGDLLFKTGTASADTAYAGLTGCGATAGTLDVDNAACNTLGEVVDKINSVADWRAVIVDGFRTDATASATLVTMAATNASQTAGLQVKWDSSVSLDATQCLNCPRTMEAYLSDPNRLASGLIPNPFAGRQAAFVIGAFTSAYATTSTIRITSVKVRHTTGSVTGSEIVTPLYAVAGAATTVQKEINLHPYGLLSVKDDKLLVRIDNTGASSGFSIYAYGESWPYRGQ